MKPIDSKPTALELSPTELRLLTAFRLVDARGKYESLALLEIEAAKYPERPAPKLSLVVGGTK